MSAGRDQRAGSRIPARRLPLAQGRRSRLGGLRDRFGRDARIALCESASDDPGSAVFTFVVVAGSERDTQALLGRIERDLERHVDAVVVDLCANGCSDASCFGSCGVRFCSCGALPDASLRTRGPRFRATDRLSIAGGARPLRKRQAGATASQHRLAAPAARHDWMYRHGV